MARKTISDRFANIASGTVIESAINTLTFQELQFGTSIGQRRGIIIDQIDYFVQPPTIAGNWVAAADFTIMAWCTRNDIPTLVDNFNDGRVLHMMHLGIQVYTAVGVNYFQNPYVHQFFPPLIVAPRAGSLFLAVQSVSQIAVVGVQSRIYFRFIDLDKEDYLELAEAFDLVG